MGLSGISPWSLLLIFAIIALLFGTKKLRGMGRDVGEAVKGFKQGYDGQQPSDPSLSSSREKSDP